MLIVAFVLSMACVGLGVVYKEGLALCRQTSPPEEYNPPSPRDDRPRFLVPYIQTSTSRLCRNQNYKFLHKFTP